MLVVIAGVAVVVAVVAVFIVVDVIAVVGVTQTIELSGSRPGVTGALTLLEG